MTGEAWPGCCLSIGSGAVASVRRVPGVPSGEWAEPGARLPGACVGPFRPPVPWAPCGQSLSQAQAAWGRAVEGGDSIYCCGSANPHPVSVSRSVRLSALSLSLSLCVCLLSSVLPSLLAPPLVSSSLTWQDEVPRLPPGAHSPRSAPGTAGRGGGSLLPGLVVLRASGQTPPPPCGPGCDCGLQTPPPRGERAPLPVWVSQGCWWPGVSDPDGCISLAFPQPTAGGAVRKFLRLGGSPSLHSRRGPRLFGSVSLSASVVCLSLSLLCPEHFGPSPSPPPLCCPHPGRGSAAWSWGLCA